MLAERFQLPWTSTSSTLSGSSSASARAPSISVSLASSSSISAVSAVSASPLLTSDITRSRALHARWNQFRTKLTNRLLNGRYSSRIGMFIAGVGTRGLALDILLALAIIILLVLFVVLGCVLAVLGARALQHVLQG